MSISRERAKRPFRGRSAKASHRLAPSARSAAWNETTRRRFGRPAAQRGRDDPRHRHGLTPTRWARNFPSAMSFRTRFLGTGSTLGGHARMTNGRFKEEWMNPILTTREYDSRGSEELQRRAISRCSYVEGEIRGIEACSANENADSQNELLEAAMHLQQGLSYRC